MRLTKSTVRRVASVAHASTTSFTRLAKIAKLNPKKSFIGADLQRVDFGTDDIGDFDFSLADLRKANLLLVAGFDRVKLDGARLDGALLPADINLDYAKIKRLLVACEEMPASWCLFIRELDLSGLTLTHLTSFQALHQLEKLVINTTAVEDIAPLTKLQNLKSLSVSGTRVSDLAPLSQVVSLQKLWINDTPVGDVGPLAHLRHLRDLYIDGTEIRTLAPLAKIPNLTVHLDGQRYRPFAGEIYIPQIANSRNRQSPHKENQMKEPKALRPGGRPRLL